MIESGSLPLPTGGLRSPIIIEREREWGEREVREINNIYRLLKLFAREQSIRVHYIQRVVNYIQVFVYVFIPHRVCVNA